MSTTQTLATGGESTLLKALLPLVGVVVGFAIGELSRILRESRRRARLCQQLREELKTNQRFIPQTKDILGQALRAMKEKRILDTNSIPFCEAIYHGHYSEIAPFLSALERNIVHVIYHSQRIIQKAMDDYDPALRSQIHDGEKQLALMEVFRIKFEDILKQLDTQEILIQSMLNGNPIDVAHLRMSYTELKQAKFGPLEKVDRR